MEKALKSVIVDRLKTTSGSGCNWFLDPDGETEGDIFGIDDRDKAGLNLGDTNGELTPSLS